MPWLLEPSYNKRQQRDTPRPEDMVGASDRTDGPLFYRRAIRSQLRAVARLLPLLSLFAWLFIDFVFFRFRFQFFLTVSVDKDRKG